MEEPLSPPYADAPGPPWAPPDPTTRYDRYDRAPVPSEPPRPAGGGSRRSRVTAVVVVLALLLGIAGYAVVDNRSSSSSSSGRPVTTPATTPAPNGANAAPVPRRPPASTPAPAAPPDTTPASGSSGSSGDVGASASTTALDVGVVDVNTELGYQGGAAAGTGMVLTASGEVLTNNHVIDGATSVTVIVVTTGKSYAATVVGTNPTSDVALLQLKGASGLEVAKLGDSSKVQVGDTVTAVGNAGGVGGAPSVKSGTVTDLDQDITASAGPNSESEDLTGLIQMSTALQPGDSGGPLYNAAGEVVGMDTAGSARRRFPRGAQGGTESFAIPINAAIDVVKQIESGVPLDTITIGTPGFLGVELAVETSNAGATISAVVSDTPADHAGLQVGDTITEVDGRTIDSAKSLGAVLKVHHGGDKVSVAWTGADGTTHTASVTLADGPAN